MKICQVVGLPLTPAPSLCTIWKEAATKISDCRIVFTLMIKKIFYPKKACGWQTWQWHRSSRRVWRRNIEGASMGYKALWTWWWTSLRMLWLQFFPSHRPLATSSLPLSHLSALGEFFIYIWGAVKKFQEDPCTLMTPYLRKMLVLGYERPFFIVWLLLN